MRSEKVKLCEGSGVSDASSETVIRAFDGGVVSVGGVAEMERRVVDGVMENLAMEAMALGLTCAPDGRMI